MKEEYPGTSGPNALEVSDLRTTSFIVVLGTADFFLTRRPLLTLCDMGVERDQKHWRRQVARI